MRASSSWIKLQFVVRKHVMNTYQMHTPLSLFWFYYIFPNPVSLFAVLFDFCVFLTPPSLQLIFSVFLMVCHIDVEYSAWLYNVPCYMYTCMHMCVRISTVRVYCDLGVLHGSVVLLMLLTNRPLACSVDNRVQTCPLDLSTVSMLFKKKSLKKWM